MKKEEVNERIDKMQRTLSELKKEEFTSYTIGRLWKQEIERTEGHLAFMKEESEKEESEFHMTACIDLVMMESIVDHAKGPKLELFKSWDFKEKTEEAK